jgi:protein-S-isoprenylcysteine O-methyltransferase Ste14
MGTDAPAYGLWPLAPREEREAMAEFGDAYRRYAGTVPAFIPRWARPAVVESNHG